MSTHDELMQVMSLLLIRNREKAWTSEEYVLYQKCIRNMDLLQDYNAIFIKKVTRDLRKSKTITGGQV